MSERKLNAARFSSNARRAFTLIELLVTISIIAILVAAATASYGNAQQKGRDGKRKSDLKGVQLALELYFQTYSRYPTSSDGIITCSGGTAGSGNNGWNQIFQCPPSPPSTNPIFMQRLPTDPSYQATSGYYYESSTATTYTLSAKLENSNDPDLAVTCTSHWSPNGFCVIQP